MADILDRIVGRIGALVPDTPRDVLTRVEAELRAEFGGCDGGYIARRPAFLRGVQIANALQAGASVAEVLQRGIAPASSSYRIMARPLQRRR